MPVEAREHGARVGVVDRLFSLCRDGLVSFQTSPYSAAASQFRGTGPGASFGALVDAARDERPVMTRRPFEGCESIAGGGGTDGQCGDAIDDALIFLEFDAGARRLPMHAHEHSARFIVVLEGRGFFHATHDRLEGFTGRSVSTTAVRERDVVAFRAGVVHTFSTHRHPMTLLSFHAPYIPLDDPRQYSLPAVRWTAEERLDPDSGAVRLGETWRPLIGTGTGAAAASG